MNTNQPISFIRELCKHKSEVEILEAEENFRRYLLLVKKVQDRIAREKALKDVDLKK